MLLLLIFSFLGVLWCPTFNVFITVNFCLSDADINCMDEVGHILMMTIVDLTTVLTETRLLKMIKITHVTQSTKI